MFQLENLETIRSKYEGMSRGFLNWHKIVPRTCRWEIRCQIFQNWPMPPPPPPGENIDRPVSMHHSLVPVGIPRAIPWKRWLPDLKNCWLRQFWMNIVPWNCQCCPSIVVEFYMSDLDGMSPESFWVILFVKFIIDLTTSNEKYGQGHLSIFDPVYYIRPAIKIL